MSKSKCITLAPIMAVILGCGGGGAGEPEPGTLQLSVVGEDSFLYLRCNATSWNLNDTSRLVESNVEGVFELDVDVNQAWMTTTGDDCNITETPVINGWGNWQNYYSTTFAPISAPTTFSLVRQPQGVVKNFRVRYPKTGRFRAQVDTRTFTISFAEPGQIAPGRVVWTAARQIALDDYGNLYRSSTDRTQLQKLDHATGAPLWTYASDPNIFLPRELHLPVLFSNACAFQNALVVNERKTPNPLTAINPNTGAVLWSSSAGGILDPFSTMGLACSAALSSIFVTHPDGLLALGRADGNVVWSRAGVFSSVVYLAEQVLVLSETHDNERIAVAVNPSSGAELWTRPTSLFNDLRQGQSGALYEVSASAVTRLDPVTGSELWTRGRPESSFVEFKSDAVFLSGGVELARIDSATGATVWSRSFAPLVFGIVLDNGLAAIISRNADETATQVTALDNRTGQQLWTNAFSGTFASPLTDAQGRLYMRDGGLGTPPAGTLRRINVGSGAVLWTYAAPLFEDSFGSSVQDIMDSDTNNLYLRYTSSRSIGSVGLTSLLATTGAVRWDNFDANELVFVGSDAERLFMVVGSRGGDVEGRVFKK